MADTAIIAFDLRDDRKIQEFARKFADEEGLEQDSHMTLFYLGDVTDLNFNQLDVTMQEFAASQAPIEGKYTGYALFDPTPENTIPVVLLYDSPQLPFMRQALRHSFADISYVQEHGFIPHTTLAYVTEPKEADYPVDYDKTFNTVWLYYGDEKYPYKLTGTLIEKQLPIDRTNMERLIEIRRNIFNDEVEELAERLFTGRISIGSWEEAMKSLIRELHASVAAISKGGWDQMTPSDWGRLGPELKKQYRFLHNFAEHIAENRETISLKQIQARSRLYGNQSTHSASVTQAGDVISKLLPWLPKDGTTTCLMNCKCMWVLRVVNIIGDWQYVEAVWTLNPAEHCSADIDRGTDGCTDREGYTEFFRVHTSVEVPEIIGGL